jgi:hypothetical protein
MGPTKGRIVEQVWVQLTHKNDVVSIFTKLNPSCFQVERCEFCVHLRSLNVSHFSMFKATGLKLWRRDHIHWQDLSTEFHENLPTGPNFISGGHTDEHTDSMVTS